MLVLVNVDHDIFYEMRYFAFWKGVIMPFTPFGKALLRLLERRYCAFLKVILTPFGKALLRLLERRYNAFLLRVMTPF